MIVINPGKQQPKPVFRGLCRACGFEADFEENEVSKAHYSDKDQRWLYSTHCRNCPEKYIPVVKRFE
jgi:hypothetical protein